MLKKCMGDPSLIIPTEDIGIKDSLSYAEILVSILDRQVCKLRTKEVASIKVHWINKFVEEATWEAEKDMKKRYPNLFEPREILVQGATHGCHPWTIGQTTARAGGALFTIATLPHPSTKKSTRSRLTDRPTIRRSDHGLWSVSIDQDLLYPASDMNYDRPARTVVRSKVRRSDRR
ncbi:hypothetical protein MTR67_031294 [Solanum verrucosum]|uniref:Uncharacterized protein n=1 Tax=Solanum verrucosum TaxID=315347 RepID=A0AAF0ZHE5_SOLVR|nr:hypothetical protein MTR67_031294 [Solanum verrucosum]